MEVTVTININAKENTYNIWIWAGRFLLQSQKINRKISEQRKKNSSNERKHFFFLVLLDWIGTKIKKIKFVNIWIFMSRISIELYKYKTHTEWFRAKSLVSDKKLSFCIHCVKCDGIFSCLKLFVFCEAYQNGKIKRFKTSLNNKFHDSVVFAITMQNVLI